MCQKFNTYRPKTGCFADHTEKVIDLLRRVCTVSARTTMITGMMKNAAR